MEYSLENLIQTRFSCFISELRTLDNNKNLRATPLDFSFTLHHHWISFFSSPAVDKQRINLIKTFKYFLPKFRHFYMFVWQVKYFFGNVPSDDVSRLYALTTVFKRYIKPQAFPLRWYIA